MKKKAALTKTELKLIAEMLERAYDEFSNHGCNDFTIPATKENKHFMVGLIEDMFDERDKEEELDSLAHSKDEIFVFDTTLMEYLANRCKKLAAK